VNGEFDYEVPFPVPIYGLSEAKQNKLPVRIGSAATGGAYWNGFLDDISVWNVVLTEAEIRRISFTRLGGNEPGLVGYWSFNEGKGTTTFDHTKSHMDGTVFGDTILWIPSEEKDMILNSCL